MKMEIEVIDNGGVQTPRERARALFDEHADRIARAAVDHLKIQYPAALKAVSRSAELSMRNSIKTNIRSRFGPLLAVMEVLETNWDQAVDPR